MAPPSMPDQFPRVEMFDTVVNIEVSEGAGKRTFQVFKGLLCFYTSYFQAALNSSFVEAQNYVVKLPTEDPKIFELFRHWIHTRCFHESTLAPYQLMPFRVVAELWVFGDAHGIPMLQNEVSDIMVQKIEELQCFPSYDDVLYICNHTVETSPLRQMLSGVYLDLTGGELVWDAIDSDDGQGIVEKAEGKGIM